MENRFDSDSPPKSVEVGEEYEIEIQEANRRGDGIAKIQGLELYVPNTKGGDKLRINITKISKRFAEADAVRAIKEKIETEIPFLCLVSTLFL
ncbi:TRAM domain-containing protein [Thermoproteota archaeon]